MFLFLFLTLWIVPTHCAYIGDDVDLDFQRLGLDKEWKLKSPSDPLDISTDLFEKRQPLVCPVDLPPSPDRPREKEKKKKERKYVDSPPASPVSQKKRKGEDNDSPPAFKKKKTVLEIQESAAAAAELGGSKLLWDNLMDDVFDLETKTEVRRLFGKMREKELEKQQLLGTTLLVLIAAHDYHVRGSFQGEVIFKEWQPLLNGVATGKNKSKLLPESLSSVADLFSKGKGNNRHFTDIVWSWLFQNEVTIESKSADESFFEPVYHCDADSFAYKVVCACKELRAQPPKKFKSTFSSLLKK